jgi:hypothetical protein
MKTLQELWCDESGSVICTELVLVGTVGVLGATVGMNLIAKSLNEEMKDLAFALRSLDQSYSVRGFSSGGASTAGSCYTQRPVKETLAAMEAEWNAPAKQPDAEAQPLANQVPADQTAEATPPDAAIPALTPQSERF